MPQEVHMTFVNGAWHMRSPENDEPWTDGRTDLHESLDKARVVAVTYQIPIRITHKDGHEETIPVSRLRSFRR